MQDLILAVNAGSSSLKLAVFQHNSNDDNKSSKNSQYLTSLYSASFSNLFTNSPTFTFSPSPSSGSSFHNIDITQGGDHKAAFRHFLEYLSKLNIQIDRIVKISHRVVHGGPFASPTVISKETFHRLEELSDLAPLHNGPALDVIGICIEALPKSKSYALFDTSFHSTIPEYISKYAIDQEIAEKKGLRKYGFHGISYSFILRQISSYISKPPNQTTVILLHLGSGASVCAVKNGKSLDTSMGLTPLDGLPGSSRSGHVDPSLIFHFTNNAGRITHEKAEKVHITEAEHILNKESGWKALTGTSNFGDITSQMSSSPTHSLAYSIFLDRLTNFLGAYILKLGGPATIDGIVFAGGIGERSSQLRSDLIKRAKCMGFRAIDEEKNKNAIKDEETNLVEISNSHEEGVRSFVCWTDEQFEMVRILVESL